MIPLAFPAHVQFFDSFGQASRPRQVLHPRIKASSGLDDSRIGGSDHNSGEDGQRLCDSHDARGDEDCLGKDVIATEPSGEAECEGW